MANFDERFDATSETPNRLWYTTQSYPPMGTARPAHMGSQSSSPIKEAFDDMSNTKYEPYTKPTVPESNDQTDQYRTPGGVRDEQ